MKYCALITTLSMSTPTFAANMTIEMLNEEAENNKMVYNDKISRVDVVDTITWVLTAKGHNVEMVASPNNIKLRLGNGKRVQSLLKSQASNTTGAPRTRSWE